MDTIEETILSVINQTYSNIEYIIIDGGSKDGTVDIIKKYQDRIAYWVSEPDGGIYEAMNKGIDKATGDWINFMNAGDTFTDKYVLDKVFKHSSFSNIDVLYGNSISVDTDCKTEIIAGDNVDDLAVYPIYRHGASFVSTKVHKTFKFDVSLKSRLGYSLDYECIFRLYKAKKTFQKVDVNILTFDKVGVSNQPIKSVWYIYLITQNRIKPSLAFFKVCLKMLMLLLLSIKFIKRIAQLIYSFFYSYILNYIICNIPVWKFRKFYYTLLGMKIGKGSVLNMSNIIWKPNNIKIGNYTHINRSCFLDGRGGLKIGSSVSISHKVNIVTGTHDVNSAKFLGVYLCTVIEDYVWVGIGATILPGVNLGKGCVIAAGSVVTKDVEPYTIVGGIPAKVIAKRNTDLDYICKWEDFFS